MTKKEMAAWYLAICLVSQELAPDTYAKSEEWESWDSFFNVWARDLWLKAGRPSAFPWRVD